MKDSPWSSPRNVGAPRDTPDLLRYHEPRFHWTSMVRREILRPVSFYLRTKHWRGGTERLR